jgi:oligoribonuclease
MQGLNGTLVDMSHPKDRIPTKLLWVDLEMTGLDPKADVILEVAATVTDFDFKPLGTYFALIHHDEEILSGMNEWSIAQHGASGLTERVRREGRPEPEVIQEFAGFIHEHFGDEPAILAGNSIHNDRTFINKWWPEVEGLLHYRMLDVSSFKVLMQGKFGVLYEKKDAHRAADDIQESMEELQFYLDRLKT